MAEATFRHGNPVYVDHTPSGAVTAGDVIVIGDQPFVAHVDIAANAKGAVASTDGVYNILADGAIGAGVKVYWDNGAKRITTTAAGNKQFGFVTADSSTAGADELIEVRHQPDVGA